MGIIRRQFYGYRQDSIDTYVTTEFAALWFLPLWPVASYKVVKDEPTNLGDQLGSNEKTGKIPIQWGQALEGWLFSLAIVGGLVFIVGFMYFATKFGWEE